MMQQTEIFDLARRMLVKYDLSNIFVFSSSTFAYSPSSKTIVYTDIWDNDTARFFNNIYTVFAEKGINIDLDINKTIIFCLLHEVGHAYQDEFEHTDFENGKKHYEKHEFANFGMSNFRFQYHLEPLEEYANNFAIDHMSEWIN